MKKKMLQLSISLALAGSFTGCTVLPTETVKALLDLIAEISIALVVSSLIG